MKPNIPGSPDSSASTDGHTGAFQALLADRYADADRPPDSRWHPVGLALSLALHVAAVLILILFADPPKPFGVAGDDAIEVVLVSARAPAVPQNGAPAAQQPSLPRPVPPRDEPEPQSPAPPIARPEPAVRAETPPEPRVPASPPSPSGKATDRLSQAPSRKREMVEAQTLYTSRLRDTALGRASLADLALADPEERIFQLCTYEAVEQLRREHPARRFDYAIAEAREEATLSGLELEAKGAAIQGRDRWYDLAFRCEVASDLMGVTAFSYLLGAEITRPERDDLDLPTGDPVH